MKYMISLATLAIMFGLIMSSTVAYAATATPPSGGFLGGLIQYIEQKFGLNKQEVENALQTYQEQKKATITPHPTLTTDQHIASQKKRLDSLVTQGKITSDQETAILNELSTVYAQYPINQTSTPEQRRSTMESIRTTLTAWAKENNISPSYVLDIGERNDQRFDRPNGKMDFDRHAEKSPTPTP